MSHAHKQIAAPQGDAVLATTSLTAFFNPTRIRCRVVLPELRQGAQKGSTEQDAKEQSHNDVHHAEYMWSTRNNRKGRHAYVYHRYPQGHPSRQKIASWVLELKHTVRKLPLFVTTFPYWDVSFIAAFLFTIGSILFTLDGFFSYLPLVNPNNDFPGNSTYVSPLMVFFGATIFQLGGIAIVLEAFNENRSDCFGAALEKALEEKHHLESNELHRLSELHGCTHRHARKTTGLFRKRSQNDKQLGHDGQFRRFEWLPSWNEVRKHYIYEIGFWASSILMIGASMFQVLGFLSLPYIQNHIGHKVELAFYDTPNVAGSVLFIISSWALALTPCALQVSLKLIHTTTHTQLSVHAWNSAQLVHSCTRCCRLARWTLEYNRLHWFSCEIRILRNTKICYWITIN